MSTVYFVRFQKNRPVAEAERAIEFLQQRCTALISAAVTGKIDSREFSKVEAA